MGKSLKANRVGLVRSTTRATGELVAEVGLADVEETDRIVSSAIQAFPSWRNTSISRRMQIMFKIRNLLDEAKDDLAAVVASEHGKNKR